MAALLPMAARFLPPEVTLSNGALTIDIGSQLAARGLSWIIPFIKEGRSRPRPASSGSPCTCTWDDWAPRGSGNQRRIHLTALIHRWP